MNGDVIIRKQKFTVKTSNEQAAFECRQFFNEIVDNELPKLYERVFYQSISSDTHINVKSLHVDLGVIALSDLKNQFINLAEQAIVKELKMQFENQDADVSGADTYPFQNLSVQYVAQKEQNTKALLFFLEHGHYPWWYIKSERKQPAKLLDDLTSAEQEQFLLNIFIRCREVDATKIRLLIKRFVNQLDNPNCEKYIKQTAALYADNNLKNNINTLLSQVEQLTKLFSISSKAFYEELFISVLALGDKTDFVKLFIGRLYERFPIANYELLKDLVNTEPKFSFLETQVPLQAERDQPNKQRDSKPTKQEIYIDNAGLILLHPFLPAYFYSLGLTDESDQFKSAENQVKASVLLYYLQCGDASYNEWEMSLNKILCGLAISDVIENGIELTEEDKTESMLLLSTVVDHWSALKGASVESVQSTFFLRAGKITYKDDAWLLQVERTAVDVLLDKLPWGFSTIKLPWLKQLIHTEW